MSNHMPENLTFSQSNCSMSPQQRVALGWKKSTKVVVPGQTLPLSSSPLASLMNTPLALPWLQATPSLTLMPASMMGMQWYLEMMSAMRSSGNLVSSMVKSSQSIMQSISVQIVSSGILLDSYPFMTFSKQLTSAQPHRHWWNPRDQKGGMADLPKQSWNFSRVSSGLCSLRKNLKSKMPPITLQVRKCLPNLYSLMASIAFELLKQLTWNKFCLSLIRQNGQQPQVCWPVPLSTTWPRSRLKIVHLPSLSLKPELNLSPIPYKQSVSSSVVIYRQQSLQMKFPSYVENKVALFDFLLILKSNGYKVYSNLTAEMLMGQVKFFRGSMGKMPSCGTSNLCLLESTILNEKSLKVQVWKVSLSDLTIGLVGLMQQSSVPVQERSRVMEDDPVIALMTRQLEREVARMRSNPTARI